jgi:holo-[acyl-carrier protein] synthase
MDARLPVVSVLGIGVDVVETARIESSIQRFGERFIHRVFLEGEIEYCASMKFSARHYGARFAAKEAISKAFGTGIGAAMGWRDIEVRRKRSGEPYVVLHGGARQLADERGVKEVMISLSHTDHYSVANAVLVGAIAAS